MFLRNVPTPSSVCTEGVVTAKEAIAVTWVDKTVIYDLLGVVSCCRRHNIRLDGHRCSREWADRLHTKKTHDASTTHTVDW